jgi:hypothetical protein
LARTSKPRKTSVEKWEEMPPPERLIAFADAGGRLLGRVVGAAVFLAAGAEVFHLIPDVIDPTRAMDIFGALAAYYGVPFLSTRAGKTR